MEAPNHCRGEKGTEKGQTMRVQHLKIITKHQGEIQSVSCFHLVNCVVECWDHGVMHTQTLGVSSLSLPTQTTLIHARKLQLPPSVFFLMSCFKNTFIKSHKGLLSSVKPSLGKQQWEKLFIHREGLQKQQSVRLWGYCIESPGSKPQPQQDTVSHFQFQNQTWFILETVKHS